MDRRLVLLTLAAGAVSPALAQAPAAPMPGPMGQAEIDHATKTAAAGTASLQMADVALQKASNPKVKEFAQFEHDEQTTIGEIIKAMAPSLGAPKLEPKATAAIEKLRETKAGPDFDRMFVKGQIDGHEELLAIQESYLKVGKDRESIGVTKLARGQIKEHLALLSDIQKGMS